MVSVVFVEAIKSADTQRRKSNLLDSFFGTSTVDTTKNVFCQQKRVKCTLFLVRCAWHVYVCLRDSCDYPIIEPCAGKSKGKPQRKRIHNNKHSKMVSLNSHKQ